jgi:hypothetical protein
MQFFAALRTAVWITSVCLCADGQTTPGATAPLSEVKGIAPRANPAEYQVSGKAGDVTIAAEFTGHAVGTPQGTLLTEDYIVVETAFFGAPGTRTKLSTENFSLRINGKKAALPGQPYGVVLPSLKDPEWEPPADTKSKSKTTMGGGGRGESNEPPAPVTMPFAVRRAMEQRVQKATLPEGDRALPVAGLIYFPYRGKTQAIKSLELIYSGPAGQATLTLLP